MIVSSSPLPLRANTRKSGLALDIFADQRQGARQRQEDGCLVRRRSNDFLIAIADGVGGHPAGDEAARLALETLSDAFPEEEGVITPLSAGGRLAEGFEAAHEAVQAFGRRLGAEKRPCSTMIAALALPRLGVFAFASAGDSHLYIAGPSRPLTRLNALHEDERGRLTSCIGGDKLTVHGPGELYLLRAGETLLLATDGLDILSGRTIEHALRVAPNATAAACALLDLVEAKRHPKQDNTSLVVVRLSAAADTAARSLSQHRAAGAAR